LIILPEYLGLLEQVSVCLPGNKLAGDPPGMAATKKGVAAFPLRADSLRYLLLHCAQWVSLKI